MAVRRIVAALCITSACALSTTTDDLKVLFPEEEEEKVDDDDFAFLDKLLPFTKVVFDTTHPSVFKDERL